MSNKILTVVKNYSYLNRRLSELMKAKRMTIHGLAAASGVAVGTIQKLTTNPSCNPTISSLNAISDALETSIIELIGQEQKMKMLDGLSVYLMNWEKLPSTLNNIQNSSEKNFESYEVIKTSCKVSKNAFALKMSDNSMLPLFPESTILIFDPEKKPLDNNYVIVKMHNHRNVIFKQL